ncbi:MAG TPA: alkaline phosphatase family protein [Xanthobacteraceae bacterium]
MRNLQILGGMIRRVSARLSLLVVVGLTAPHVPAASATPSGPKPRHVFIIVLENEGFGVTFGAKSPAGYLKGLAQQGALLQNYYGIGHYSLDNYLAMVSGQVPNPVTQADCQSFVDFTASGTTRDGQAIGTGCVYPSSVSTVANQLEAKGLSWKGYMEDMGKDPSRESATCGHPEVGQPDGTQKAVPADQYASRHDPFVYFHSIIDLPTCAAHVVNLSALASDLQDEATTPNYAFITPNLCHDGHDQPCKNGEPGGLVSADKFLADTVPEILASPAFRHDGLLIVTFDEADSEGHDASACCHETRGPNIRPGAMIVFGPSDKIPDKGPGITGPGGGRVGAVLVSPLIKPGTESKKPYNHYALLRSLEDFFDLPHLGYAGKMGLKSFGKDVFSAPQ